MKFSQLINFDIINIPIDDEQIALDYAATMIIHILIIIYTNQIYFKKFSHAVLKYICMINILNISNSKFFNW